MTEVVSKPRGNQEQFFTAEATANAKAPRQLPGTSDNHKEATMAGLERAKV